MHTLIIALRSSLFLVIQTFLTVIFALLAILILPLPYKIRYCVISSWSKCIVFIAKYLCGIHYQVTGLENLTDKPAILLSNHQSTWETLFIQCLLPYQTWVLKKELLYIPFFGWGLWALEPIAIDRKRASSLKQLVEQGQEKLKKGRWVVLFPEGSRLPAGKLGRFSKGGALLSVESNTPITPMAHNAGRCWGKNAFMKYPHTIQVNIGPPINPEGKTTDEIHNLYKAWIENNLPQ